MGRSDGAASEAFRVTEYDNVSTGVVFLDCKGEALANVLLEVTGGATRAEDDHYTLGLPRPRAEPRYRRSSDPPPLPLATHALTLRRADEGDLATLTYALPKHGLRLRAADLQRRCTDSRRTSLVFGEVRGDCVIWCPPPHPVDLSILRPRVSRAAGAMHVHGGRLFVSLRAEREREREGGREREDDHARSPGAAAGRVVGVTKLQVVLRRLVSSGYSNRVSCSIEYPTTAGEHRTGDCCMYLVCTA